MSGGCPLDRDWETEPMSLSIRIMSLLVFFVTLSVHSGALGCTLKEFLGPFPGLKYVYSGSDGSTMEVTRISTSVNKTVEIKELTSFPEDILPPNAPKAVAVQYSLKVHADKMIKESERGKEIVLQEPLAEEAKPWKINGKAGSKTDRGRMKWKDIKSMCKIVEIGRANYFGKERCIITTKCVTSNTSLRTERLETYAENIGLIERVLNAKTEDGELKKTFRLSLEKIIKME